MSLGTKRASEIVVADALTAQVEAATQREIRTMTQSMAEFLHAQGRAEGQVEGALISSREILRDLLESRFGPLPEGIRRRIDSTTDLQRLKACIHQVRALDELPL